MAQQEFIPYEQALELKELGFDEHCLAFYGGDGDSKIYYNSLRNGSGDYVPYKASERHKWFGAPLYQQAFRWFREKHNLFSVIDVDQTMEPKFCYSLSKYADPYDWAILVFNSELYYTYEEAELACLKKLIEIVKNDLGEYDNIQAGN
jgi:hypothetical protein